MPFHEFRFTSPIRERPRQIYLLLDGLMNGSIRMLELCLEFDRATGYQFAHVEFIDPYYVDREVLGESSSMGMLRQQQVATASFHVEHDEADILKERISISKRSPFGDIPAFELTVSTN